MKGKQIAEWLVDRDGGIKKYGIEAEWKYLMFVMNNVQTYSIRILTYVQDVSVVYV